MRTHVLVALVALLAGVGGGYALSLVLREEHPARVAVAEPEHANSGPAAESTTHRETGPQAEPSADVGSPPTADATKAAELPGADEPTNTYSIRARVVDAAGEPLSGISFRWHPALWGRFDRFPNAIDFDSSEAYEAAVLTHVNAIARLKVVGTIEVACDADGWLKVADSVASSGSAELIEPGWVTRSGGDVHLSSSREGTITLVRSAPLEVIIRLADGSSAPNARLSIRYGDGLAYHLFGIDVSELPATVSVPIGSAAISFSKFEAATTIEAVGIEILPDHPNRIEVQAREATTLFVRCQRPPGTHVNLRLTPAQAGLSDKEAASDDSSGQYPTWSGQGARFTVGIGEYVLAAIGDKHVLSATPIQIAEGFNETRLDLVPPDGWKQLTLTLIAEGKPVAADRQLYLMVLPRLGVLWSRETGSATYLLLPEIASSSSATLFAESKDFGQTQVRFNPALDVALEVRFSEPVRFELVVNGCRDGLARNVSISAVTLPTGDGSKVGTPVARAGTPEVADVDFGNMQPDRYKLYLNWKAGLLSQPRLVLGEFEVRADTVATINLPRLHVLTVVLPKNSVRGFVHVQPEGKQWTGTVHSPGESSLLHIRFLTTGTYTLSWRDSENAEHTHEVYVREDTVFKPFGD